MNETNSCNNLPLYEMGLRPKVFNLLTREYHIETVGDLPKLPEAVMRRYVVELLEGIHRVHRKMRPPDCDPECDCEHFLKEDLHD